MRLAAPALALALCACTAPIRQRIQPPSVNGSNLGISLSMVAPIGIITLKPTVIYFAKVDMENGLFQPYVIPSNYSSGGLHYALDVQPGTYVAVGAQNVRDKNASFTIFFSSSLVERTITTVGDQELAYMGDHWTYMIPGLWGADAAQNHYSRLIAPPRLNAGLLQTLIGDTYYRGVMMRSRNDDEMRDAFFRQAKVDLKGSATAIPVVRVAERFFWIGPEGNLGLEIKARFKSQAILEKMLDPNMPVGSFKGKNSASGSLDWTLRDILVSVNFNSAKTAAVWRVSGPRPLIADYAQILAHGAKKYSILQDVSYHEVRYTATAD